MKSVGLVQIFCPVKETNRTHSRGYVEDLSTQTGRKRCTKTAVLNLSVLPKPLREGVPSCRGFCVGRHPFCPFVSMLHWDIHHFDTPIVASYALRWKSF